MHRSPPRFERAGHGHRTGEPTPSRAILNAPWIAVWGAFAFQAPHRAARPKGTNPKCRVGCAPCRASVPTCYPPSFASDGSDAPPETPSAALATSNAARAASGEPSHAPSAASVTSRFRADTSADGSAPERHAAFNVATCSPRASAASERERVARRIGAGQLGEPPRTAAPSSRSNTYHNYR